MKTRFLREIFISKARKKFFSRRMSMFWVSRSKFKHQTLRSKKNYAHTTSRFNRNAWNSNHIRKWVPPPYFLSIWRTQKPVWNPVFWGRFLFQRLVKNFFRVEWVCSGYLEVSLNIKLYARKKIMLIRRLDSIVTPEIRITSENGSHHRIF